MEKKVLGIITGGWSGPEVIDSAMSVLRVIEDAGDTEFDVQYLDYDNWEDTETNPKKFYGYIQDFYKKIQAKKGAILRGSIHAPIVYKLREDFELSTKLVPLKYLPELIDSSLLKNDIAKRIDVLLVRENSHGPYHADYQLKESSNRQQSVVGNFSYDKKSLDQLADVAFKLATGRSKKLILGIKSEALGALGDLWLQSFGDVSKRYPEVAFSKISMGNCVSDIFYKPKEFDVLVAPDVEADIVADIVPRLLYGTTLITPSANIASDGFASYQTNHGTVKPLAGQDKINPLGMIHALAMCLEHSFNMPKEANMVRDAVKQTLADGYRTMDIYRKEHHKLVGTKEMTQHIVDNLKVLHEEKIK